MTIDACFLKKILEDRIPLSRIALAPEALAPKEQAALKYFQDFFLRFGQYPSLSTVEEACGVSFAVETPEPFEFYLSKLQDRALMNLLGDGLAEAVERIKKGDTAGVLESVRSVCQKANSQVEKGENIPKLVDMRTTCEARYQGYQNRKNGVERGIPTPWPSITRATNGFGKGELWAFLGRLKTGKSWLLGHLAAHFLREGYSSLTLSMEMPIDLVARRVDALLGMVPIDGLRSGQLETLQEQQYLESLHVLANAQTPLWIAGNGKIKTVMDLEMLMEENKPQVVLIDGMYFLRSGEKNADRDKYTRVAMVVDQIQNLALRTQIPIIISSQFNRGVTKNTDGASENVGFAYEIPQNCNTVVALNRSDDLRAQKQMKISVMEVREGYEVDVLSEWDLDRMAFGELGIYKDDNFMPTQNGQTVSADGWNYGRF